MKTRYFNLAALILFYFNLSDVLCQWVPMTPQYGSYVLSLAQDSAKIYAGMDNGVFISTNNGTSWEAAGLAGRRVQTVLITERSVFAGTDTGNFVSTDNGSSWSDGGMAGISITSFCAVAGQLFAGTKTQGLFMTSDNGITWKPAGLSGYGVNTLAVDGTRIIASASFSGVFVSVDTGRTWKSSNVGLTTMNVGPLLVDSAKIYVGTNVGVFVSQDSGTNWALLNWGTRYGQVISLIKTGGNLTAGTSANGIVYSTDNGMTWKPSNLTSWSNPWSSTSVNILVQSGSDSSGFTGTVSMGVFRSTDSGVTWMACGLNSTPIRAITSNGKYLFQGSSGSGVFRSSDDGSTWIPVDVGIAWPGIYSFAVTDTDVFVGTQTDFGGVYRSSDNGDTWSLTALQGRQIYCLVANDSFILAGGPAGAPYSGGLFISTDGGTSWTQSINRGTLGINSVAIGDTNFFATDLNNQGIFVSTNYGGSWISQYGGSSIAVIGRSVFVGAFYNTVGFLSMDNGITWSQTATPGNIYGLTTSHDTIYAATDHGVFASTDLGTSWGDVGAGLSHAWFWSIAVADGYLFAGSGTGQIWRRPISHMIILAPRPPSMVSPRNDSTFFSDSVKCVWNSVYGVSSYRLQVGYDPEFNSIFLEAPLVADTTLEIRGLRPATKYFWRVSGNDSPGLVSWSAIWNFNTGVDTTNQAKNWVNLGSPGHSAVRAINLNGSRLFAGTNYDGIFSSIDDGLTWAKADSGLNDFRISSIAVNDSDVFVGTYQDTGVLAHVGVYRSTDNGDSWALTGLQGRQIYCLAASDSFILAGGSAGATYSGGLFISTDVGTTWTQSIDRGELGINSVAIGGANFFATDLNNQGIFVSTNHGINWASQYGGSSIGIIGKNIFVGAFYNSIGFISADNGASWLQTTTPGDIYGLAVSDSDIFAATDHGAFASHNMGVSWSNITGGLTDTKLWCISVGNGFLFIGSDSGYVYRRPLTGIPTAVSEPGNGTVPKSFRLEQNYPNPFNPSTTISFDLRENSTVKLEIFNLLGQRMELFTMGMMESGSYKNIIDMSRFASGVYIYRIEIIGVDGQSFTSTKKMVLVK